jgi:hypothetical protein
MPKPIFIVGNQRSGTTWLSNILCQHNKIIGVQSEPFGIRESSYFNFIEGFFGSLKKDNNFIQFIETIGSMDYFRLTGIKKDLLYQKKPKTYSQAFRLLMDSFANKEKAEYWLEKSPGHTLFLRKISNYYKDSKFIGIKRNTLDTLRSAVRRTVIRNNFIKKIFIIKRLLQHFKYSKHLNRFNSLSNRILIINYEDLIKSTQETLTKLCNFLDIEYEPSLLIEKYRPNTSFTTFNKQEERAVILSSFDRKLIKWTSSIFEIFPYRFYKILYFFQLNTRKRELPLKLWKDFKKENFKEKNN